MTCLYGLFVMVLLILGLVSVLKPELLSRKHLKWVQDWAAELGLELRSYRHDGFELSGLRGGVSVSLTWTGTRTTVQVERLAIPSTLSLTESRLRQTGLSTGDHAFDIRVKVEGDEAIAIALLDGKTRDLVAQLITMSGKVEDSRITISQNDVWAGSQNHQERATHSIKNLDFATELSHRLALSGVHLPARLADNAAKDRLPGVRRQNLVALERHFPKHEECLASYRLALEDLAPEIRILAADYLLNRPGTELADVDDAAKVLAEIASKKHLAADLRARSIKNLSHHRIRNKAVRAETESILKGALGEKKAELLVAALGCIGALELRGFLPRLLELAPKAENPVAAALAQTFGQLGGDEAQKGLLELLQKEDPKVQQESAEALGKVGDAKAVESLLELARRVKAPQNEIAFDAVRRIQGRLPEAEAGQLSLVVPAELEGALSPSEDAPGPGDVSVAEAPET